MGPVHTALRRASSSLLPLVVAALGLGAGAAEAQTETLLYDHVHLRAPDPLAAAGWYLEQFGGEFVDGREDRVLIGTTRIMFNPAEGSPPSAGTGVDHLGFSVTDLDAKVRELEAAGATVTTPPRDVEGLFRLAFLTDPWGIRLEVVQDPQHLGFHHLHLRSPDPAQTLQWYVDHFGGVRTRMRGRLDGVLYPGNIWLLVQQGEATQTDGSAIDHLGWRTADVAQKLDELRAKGVTVVEEPRIVTLPAGDIRIAYVRGPNGVRIELVERTSNSR